MIARIRVARQAHDLPRRVIDYLIAEVLFRLPLSARRRLFAGDRYWCPICGSQLRSFLHLHRPSMLWCPVCRSLQRHRQIWRLLEREILPRRLPRRILHIAPESSLATQLLAISPGGYVSADRYDPKAGVRLDLALLPFADAAFDLILCSHVLEHVGDDRASLRELRRVLHKDGQALILVPILASKTWEDPCITDPVARERAFGQHDHVRAYGPDVVERFAEAAFHVKQFSLADLATTAEIDRYGLAPGEIIFVCAGFGQEHNTT